MNDDSAVVDRVLRSLRSTRSYDPVRQVSDDLVTRWLETARWCGSSKNSQPWRFAVIRDRSTLERLSKCGHHADHLPSSSVTVAIGLADYPHEFSAVLDLGRVAQSLMANAHADGVGSCIAVFEPEYEDEVRRILEGSSAMICRFAIGFGYPASRSTETPSIGGYGRRPLADLVGSDRFPHEG